MSLPEAITYALVQRNFCLRDKSSGLTTDQIAELINRNHWHIRKDGNLVTSAQVYATIMRYPQQFCKAEGRIMLLM